MVVHCVNGPLSLWGYFPCPGLYILITCADIDIEFVVNPKVLTRLWSPQVIGETGEVLPIVNCGVYVCTYIEWDPATTILNAVRIICQSIGCGINHRVADIIASHLRYVEIGHMVRILKITPEGPRPKGSKPRPPPIPDGLYMFPYTEDMMRYMAMKALQNHHVLNSCFLRESSNVTQFTFVFP
jgi:hypothetical protein